MLYNTEEHTTVQCMQFSTMQCSIVYYCVVQCIGQWRVMYVALVGIWSWAATLALQPICEVYTSALYCVALVHCRPVQCTAVLLLYTLNYCSALQPCAVHSILPRSIRSRNACSIKGAGGGQAAAGINRESYHWPLGTLGQLLLDSCTLLSLGICPVHLYASFEFSRFFGIWYFPFPSGKRCRQVPP